MHIVRALIEDFQKHKRLELSLSPDTNAIIGSGDKGKSAIIRAIKWCLTNQPDGDDFVRFWYETDKDGNEKKLLSKRTCVELELSTGYIIRRIRTPKTNNYEVVDPKGEKTVLANFRKSLRKGQLVPDLVLNATGVGTITLGETKNVCVQIQDQHDAPFLIGGISAPARWRAFSHLAGTEAADKTVYSFNSEIHIAGREIKAKTKSVESDRVELSTEKTALAKVETLHDQLAALRDKVKKAQELRDAIDDGIQNGMRVNQELQANRVRVAKEREYAEALVVSQKKAQTALETWQALGRLSSSYEQTDRAITALTAERQTLRPVAALESPTLPIIQKRRIDDLLNRYQSVIERGDDTGLALKSASAIVELNETKPDVELFHQLCTLTEKGKQWQQNEADEKSRLSKTSQEVADAEESLLKALQQAARCPRCRQDTTTLTLSSCT